jgi:class 3 adenylate cyclase/tetratricopeptide (TPR) repeat protein
MCASCGQETPSGFPRCAICGAPLEALPPAREQRKTVTVVFCDITGSTELGESTDPEALRAVLARYFERMKGIVESHGGSVEKFIGDAVMAAFGVPVAHEDDALRGCRTAVGMRDALPALGVAGRIGVNTGEVVTGTEERLATGDAVNVAARLEQAAQPGEVLIGEETLKLVRGAVELGPERLLELKGKAEPVRAHPLLAVTGELERRFATPMVGRERELQSLRDAAARADADRSCQLFTILGSAGVGKSRLAAEFLRPAVARVVRGRCLSYGEGITYWPVVEILKQLRVLPEGDPARPLRSLLGETDQPASAEEIAWGFRKLLEQEAQTQPLVCVFDDLHWAEETLLDLVEHVADLSRDAPLLLLCLARPELLERRPSWGGGKWNASTVLLEPLDDADTERLLAELGEVPSNLHGRIVEVAEGNPLFLEEMLALVRDAGGGQVEVPPTIQALLAARLDQLEPAERSVLEHGSVEGRTFHRGAVAALGDGNDEVDRRLVALVRKELVRPDRPQLPGDDAYRFRHLLVRDAAYDALPKATRADLHRRFAAWLEQHSESLVELDEILGYHLERAAHYLQELGRADPELALAAGERLAAAGRRALWRADRRSATLLLERSLKLTRAHRLDVHLELDLAWANEQEPRSSAKIAAVAADQAVAAGEQDAALLARVASALYRLMVVEGSAEEVEQLAKQALPRLEALGDDRGLVTVWWALSEAANWHGRFADRAEACEQALKYSRLAGDHSRHADNLSFALTLGPQPAGEALLKLDQLDPDSEEPAVVLNRAWLLAMLDRFDEARALAAAAVEQLQEFGHPDIPSYWLSEIALLAGDFEQAVMQHRVWCEHLESGGRQAELSTYAPQLGRLLCNLGRYDEAEPLAEQGRELGDPDDASTQVAWRRTKALVCSARGQHGDAEQLAREAVAWAKRTDSLEHHGDACCDLAEVLEAAGRRDEAVEAWQEALDRYERKQIIPLARRTRERLAALQETPS